jgi:thiol:disulfide interchange protein
MRTSFIRGAMAGACLLAIAGAAHGQGKISWAKSFSAAMARARTSHKLVMADFYTDW